MKILVTGGSGYIGSHTLIELIKSGHDILVVDSLINSDEEALARVEQIVNKSIPFYKFDIRDKAKLNELFKQHKFEAIIHFAGLKSVGESVAQPIEYYENNIASTLNLLRCAEEYGVKKFIFSSSATVYGVPQELPLTEESPTGIGITNPYGQTKFMIEQILKDLWIADNSFEITLLRYFNPVGADKSGLIGEDPNGIPNNILPYIAQVAVGKLKSVKVYGNDYDTVDGTGVRDYIHVVDLARGHVAALEHSKTGVHIYNLCSGKGTSVLELLAAFSKASGKEIPYEIVDRRPGDIAACYASALKANQELGWFAQKTIQEACEDSWRWQSKNPNGYQK